MMDSTWPVQDSTLQTATSSDSNTHFKIDSQVLHIYLPHAHKLSEGALTSPSTARTKHYILCCIIRSQVIAMSVLPGKHGAL